jgi:uncharacterized membrane protein YfcA
VHPRPVVNYDALLILLPMTLAGTTVGHIMGRVVPDWLRIVFLFLLLGYILKRSLEKARATKENLERDSAMKAEFARSELTETVNVILYPPRQLIAITLIWLFLAAMAWGKSTIACGSIGYWILFTTVVVVCIVVASVTAVIFMRRTRLSSFTLDQVQTEMLSPTQKSSESTAAAVSQSVNIANHNSFYGDVIWTRRNAVYFPALSIFAGIGASVLGIGGGMVLGIILLEMDLHTEAVSATSGVATFFAASMAGGQLALGGELPLDYGGMFFCVGILSTILGQFGINAYIRRHNMNNFIIYSLSVITAGSLVCLAVVGAMNIIQTALNDGDFGFGSVCNLG